MKRINLCHKYDYMVLENTYIMYIINPTELSISFTCYSTTNSKTLIHAYHKYKENFSKPENIILGSDTNEDNISYKT